MSSAPACKLCSKVLTAATAPSGLCRECLISTGVGIGTIPVGDETRTAIAPPAAETRTADTFSLSDTDAVPPPVHSSSVRMALIQELHGFIDVTPMLTPGGMGDLYRAFDPALNRSVVVKFVRWDARSPTNLRRFAAEARALALVDHENVARLFSFIETGDPHFTMEDVPGGSLNERLLDGPLEPKLAARLLMASARGVAAVHRQGLVHRDLKPANLLLTSKHADATPKVADFGIAKDLDALETLTQTSALIGTPGFMSPEAADWRSAECDARSDVWGLCATLFCAVTGKPPFDRNRRPAAVLFEPLVPPIKLRPTLPRELNAIICKGLEKDPADRYQTVDELADDLGRFLDGLLPYARSRPLPVKLWRGARRVPKAVAAALVVALLATAALVAVLMKDKQATAATPEPTAEQKVEALMGELKQGRPVTLVGEKGLPVWSKTALGAYSENTLAATGGSFGLQSADFGICQLTPALPIDRYDVQFEISDVAALPSPVQGNPQYLLGFVIGYEEFAASEEHLLSNGISIQWRDVDVRRAPQQPIQNSQMRVAHQLFIQRVGRTLSSPTESLAQFSFEPTRTASNVGRWRRVRVSVSPESLSVFWCDDGGVELMVAHLTTSEIRASKLKLISSLPNYVADFTGKIPDWNPSGAVGLVVDQCVIGTRNIRIVPH